MKASIVSVFVLCLLLATPYATSHALDISLIGADPGPNATGEIPAWEGHKNLPCPSDYTPGQYFPNPYKDDRPLFRIDHTNVEEYKDRLFPWTDHAAAEAQELLHERLYEPSKH